MRTLLALVALWLVACSHDRVVPPPVPAPIEIAARTLPIPPPPSFHGVVTSRTSQMVTATAAGVIKELRVAKGDIVAAGQVLAILDDPALRATAAKMPKRSKARAAIEKRLASMKIIAPSGGIVSAIEIAAGAATKRGASVLRLSSTKRLQLRFALPHDQQGRIAKGTKVRAMIAGRATPIDAVVRSVGPTTEAPIRIAIVDAELSGVRDTTGLFGTLADVTVAPETR